MNKTIFFIWTFCTLAFFACNNGAVNEPLPESTGTIEDLEEAIIDFGLSTFQEVLKEGDENVLISPLSIETALYMTMSGTAETTLEEFRSTLKLDQFYPDGLNQRYAELVEKLEPKNQVTQLGLHNTVFHYPTLVTLDNNFKTSVESSYEAEITDADFSNEATVDLINAWAEEKTEGRIKKVLDKIEADEAVFLINALFFKSDWEKGFLPEITQSRPFNKADGESIDIDFMSSDDERDHYFGPDFKAVDLKFKDSEYSMTFIRPETTTILDFVLGFSDSDFLVMYQDLYENKLSKGRIQTYLPKFEISTKKNLADVLKNMGMITAFESADLSRMGQFAGNTYLSRVLHDAYLKIDEKGAEGAAVTTVGVGVESVPPTINLDIPFLFILRHVETNTPIFIGKCGNPTE